MLPELSYALGLAGAYGCQSIAESGPDSMGLSAGRVLGIDPARPGRITYRYRLPPFIRVADPRTFFDRLAPTDCWNRESRQPNYEGFPTCEGPAPGCELIRTRIETASECVVPVAPFVGTGFAATAVTTTSARNTTRFWFLRRCGRRFVLPGLDPCVRPGCSDATMIGYPGERAV